MAAICALREVDEFAAHCRARSVGLGLDECTLVLGRFIRGLDGPANYVVIADVAKLPLKVADIYGRLTT